jgi:hypothetical protein
VIYTPFSWHTVSPAGACSLPAHNKETAESGKWSLFYTNCTSYQSKTFQISISPSNPLSAAQNIGVHTITRT